jgi:RNA polymerase sigma-70 factor (ECF subfamily)
VTEPERDEELVRRFRAGEADAFTALVQRHQQRVYSLCVRVLGDTDAAADVTQDTFLTVLRKIEGFRGEAAFTTWLHRVAVNACYDELRRKQRRPMLHVVADGDREHETGPPVLDHADDVAGAHDTAWALARIPEEFRVALLLADVHDMAYEQIAQVLDVPIGTVKSRVHRGRLGLGKVMGLEPNDREPDVGSAPSEREP